jgi:hypothetical protein
VTLATKGAAEVGWSRSGWRGGQLKGFNWTGNTRVLFWIIAALVLAFWFFLQFQYYWKAPRRRAVAALVRFSGRNCAEADVAEVIGSYWLALAVLFSGLALLSYSGGKLFGFLPTRARRILANVAYYLMAGILLWFVVGSVIGWFVDLPSREPSEGEPCGPGYKWTRADPGNDPDLSCEKE